MYGMISTVFKNEQRNGVPLWHSMLRIQHCHYRGLGHSCGTDSTPGPGTPHALHGQKKKAEEKTLKNNHSTI